MITEENGSEVIGSVRTIVERAQFAEKQLRALLAAVEELPHSPPGFSDGPVDRLQWTAKWVKDHWADAQVAKEWKQRYLQAASGDALRRVANLIRRIDVLPISISTNVGTGEPSFMFAVQCDEYAELQDLLRCVDEAQKEGKQS